jgi:hypothetical protein
MAKKLIRLTESDLHNIVSNVVKKSINETNELYQEWYDEEDYDGNTGQMGFIRTYNIGTYYVSNAEEDAKECGYEGLNDYLSFWFNEIKQDCPWYWTQVGRGYGFYGTTLFQEGNVRFKEIYGQIMVDEYPPVGVPNNLGENVNKSKNMKKKVIRMTESDLHNIVIECANRLLNEVGDTARGMELLGRLAAKKVTKDRNINGYHDVQDYAREKWRQNLENHDDFTKAYHKEREKLLANKCNA